MKITAAPTKEKFLEGDIPAKGWLQWLSTVGDALAGEWVTNDKRVFTYNNISTPNSVYLNYSGRVMHFLIIWNSVTPGTLSSASVVLNKEDYRMQGGYLDLYDVGNRFTQGAWASDKTITLPNVTATGGQLALQGTILVRN